MSFRQPASCTVTLSVFQCRTNVHYGAYLASYIVARQISMICHKRLKVLYGFDSKPGFQK